MLCKWNAEKMILFGDFSAYDIMSNKEKYADLVIFFTKYGLAPFSIQEMFMDVEFTNNDIQRPIPQQKILLRPAFMSELGKVIIASDRIELEINNIDDEESIPSKFIEFIIQLEKIYNIKYDRLSYQSSYIYDDDWEKIYNVFFSKMEKKAKGTDAWNFIFNRKYNVNIHDEILESHSIFNMKTMRNKKTNDYIVNFNFEFSILQLKCSCYNVKEIKKFIDAAQEKIRDMQNIWGVSSDVSKSEF